MVDIKLSTFLKNNIIGQAASEVSVIAKFPNETAHLMALCCSSWAVGMKYRVAFYDGETVPCNLFFMAEARSGEGKSRAMKMLTRGMSDVIQKERLRRLDVVAKYEAEMIDNNGGKTTSINHEEMKLFEKVKAENHPLSHTASDMTDAAFDNMLRDQHGWFVLKTTEQGLIDSLFMGKYSDGGSNLDPLLNAFDGEYSETRRAGRVGFSGVPHGGVGVVSQSGLIEKIIEASGNRGLTQRFFMMLEPTLMGTRTFSLEKLKAVKVDKLNEICAKIATDAIKNIKCLEIDNLEVLNICREGWEEIYNYKNKIEPMLGVGGIYEPAMLSSMWSKVELFVMKVASTLHVINQNKGNNISVDTVLDSILIVEALFTGVSKIAESKGIVGINIEERAVLEYMEEKARMRGIDIQKIKNTLTRRKIFAEYQENKSKRVEEVVLSLVKKGKLTSDNINGNVVYKFLRY